MDAASKAQIALWRQLVLRAARRGVLYADAQDLAGQAFLKALESFDESRGEFAPFCRAVHSNLLKNHWRDRREFVEFDPESDGPAGSSDPAGGLMDEQIRTRMRGLADRILACLTPQQAAFFLALGQAVEEMEYGAVSEAARIVGVSPQQGHDIYRQIQRKARRFAGDFRDVWPIRRAIGETAAPPERDVAAASVPPPEAPPSAPPDLAFEDVVCSFAARMPAADPFLFSAIRCATAGYERFEASLTSEQRERLGSLLR